MKQPEIRLSILRPILTRPGLLYLLPVEPLPGWMRVILRLFPKAEMWSVHGVTKVETLIIWHLTTLQIRPLMLIHKMD